MKCTSEVVLMESDLVIVRSLIINLKTFRKHAPKKSKQLNVAKFSLLSGYSPLWSMKPHEGFLELYKWVILMNSFKYDGLASWVKSLLQIF